MSKKESQTGSEGLVHEQSLSKESNDIITTDISSLKSKKQKKTSDFVAELAYENSKADAFEFLTKKIKSEAPVSLKRPPLLDPSDLFTVKLKKSPATSSIKVNNGESLNETARKQLRFNRCATQVSQIYPYLYISGDMMAKNLEKLLEKNIKYVLNLAPSVCKNYFQEQKHFTYKNLNLLDSTTEIDMLWAFLKSIDFIEASTKGQSSQACFVHCHQGVSRSGAIMVAFVMYKDKLSFREAFEVVKAKHEVCSPNSAFIAQLIKFEKRLGYGVSGSTGSFEEEVFIVKRHSARDPMLIIKPLDVDKLTAHLDNLGGIYDVLDTRGTFIVYKSSSELETFSSVLVQALGMFSGVFFIIEGHQVTNKAAFKQAAMDYVNLLKKYIPIYEEARTVFVDSKGKLLDDISGGKFDFFKVLGRAETTFKAFKHMDAFFPVGQEATGSQQQEDSNLEEVLKQVPKNEKLSVKLFHCKVENGLHSFEYVEDYDSEDLVSSGAFILEVFNTEENIIRYFIWLGKDIEAIINEQAVTELCTDYINSDLKAAFMTSGQNVTDQGTDIEREGAESKDFLIAFDSGL